MWKNGLIKKIRLISTIVIRSLRNITRSKKKKSINEIWSVNRITWEAFLLKNDTQNLVKKLFPDTFLKNQNWAYLWINSLQFVFTVCQADDCCNLLKLSCRPLVIFCYILLLLFSIAWPNFIVCLLLLCEILGKICIVIVC